MLTRTLIIFLLLLLSGCINTLDPGSARPDDDSTTNTWPFTTVQVMDDCFSICYEPTVAMSADGQLYVAHGYSASAANEWIGADTFSQFYRGSAPYDAFEKVPLPERPFGLTNLMRGDNTLTTGPDGSLWYIGLYFAGSIYGPLGAIETIDGIQVAVSHDGGDSWTYNHYFSPQTGYLSGHGSDRPWVFFGDQDEVFVTYKQYLSAVNAVPSVGAWLLRSQDGGATFDDGIQFWAPNEGGNHIVIGRGAAKGDFILFPTIRIDGNYGRHGAVIYSMDGGQTFQQEDLPLEEINSGVKAITSAAINAQSGASFLALTTETGQQLFRWTPGREWESFQFASSKGSLFHPWIEIGTQSLYANWMAGGGNGCCDVYFQELDFDGNTLGEAKVHKRTASQTGPFTDFPAFALAPDEGSAAVVWSDGENAHFARIEL